MKYICIKRGKENEQLHKLTEIEVFDTEQQARWYCICHPDMTYKKLEHKKAT